MPLQAPHRTVSAATVGCFYNFGSVTRLLSLVRLSETRLNSEETATRGVKRPNKLVRRDPKRRDRLFCGFLSCTPKNGVGVYLKET